MFGLFEASGRAVAELRQPGVKPRGVPKRVTADLLEGVLAQARPGDVSVTPHDDALRNRLLPGFWPHAALFLGSREALGALGVEHPEVSAGGHCLPAEELLDQPLAFGFRIIATGGRREGIVDRQ
jgi:hypothetical protein